MDTTPNTTPLPPQSPRPDGDRHDRPGARLYRAPEGQRSVAGVARGLADYLGVAAGWVRLAFVLFTFVGGLGLVAYLALWVLVPERPTGVPPARGDHNLRLDSAPAFFGAVLILIAVSILFSEFSFWSGSVFWAVVLIIAGVALFQRAGAGHPSPDATGADAPGGVGARLSGDAPGAPPAPPPPATTRPDAPRAGTGPAPAPPAPSGPGYRGPGGTAAWTPPPQQWQPQRVKAPARPKERSVLGRVTIAAALVVVGTLIWLDQLGVVGLTAVQIGATGLGVLGTGLVIGTLFGRARWLMALVVFTAAPLITAASLDVPIDLSSGQRTLAPATVEELPAAYELGAGELAVDLTGLDLDGERVELDVNVGLGEVTVTVPEGMGLEATASAGLGEVDAFGARTEGFGVERTARRAPTGDGGTLVLDARAGLGVVTIDSTEEAR